MLDIGPGLIEVQRIQVITRGNALIQLPQLRPREHLSKLWLANQNNLQQFFRY